MLIKDVLKALETTKTAILAKEIGIGERKLREALKAAGYIYQNTAPKGWHYVGEGEQPLETPIQDYITIRTTNTNSKPKAQGASKTTPKEDMRNALTPHEVSMLRDMITEWETIKGAANTVAATNTGVVEMKETTHETAQQPVHSINELYIRVKQEIQPQKKLRKTLSINEGVGKALDIFAARHKIDKQDLIEIALRDLFAKYKGNNTDLREEKEVKTSLVGKKIRRD